MQFTWRQLAKYETNHEILWLNVSVGSLTVASIWLALGLPWPTCVFHELTGLPCLTCGATRCTIAFLHGDFAMAWTWNPLALLALSGVALFDLYALIVLVFRAPRLRIVAFTRRAKNFARLMAVAALALNWIFLLSHWRNF
jgi:Protein of unknown function (DUF2752)